MDVKQNRTKIGSTEIKVMRRLSGYKVSGGKIMRY